MKHRPQLEKNTPDSKLHSRENQLKERLGKLTNLEDNWTITGPIHASVRSEIFKATHPLQKKPLRLKLSKSKKSPDPKLLKEYTSLNTFQKKFDETGQYTIAEAISLEKEINCLITAWEEGSSLAQYLSQWRNMLSPKKFQDKRKNYFTNSGRWLREFHSIGDMRKQAFDSKVILDDLEGRLGKIKKKDTRLLENTVFRLSLEIMRHISKNLHGNSVETSIIHGDFAPRNILYNEDCIIGIDLANTSRQYCAFDLGHFIIETHLHNHISLWSKNSLAEDTDAFQFLLGYQHPTDEQTTQLLYCFCLHETIKKWISFNNKKSLTVRKTKKTPVYEIIWFSYRCLQMERIAKRLIQHKPF